jgi:hypothetical protein
MPRNISRHCSVSVLPCEGDMRRHPDTAVYLSRVKVNESDFGTAAHFTFHKPGSGSWKNKTADPTTHPDHLYPNRSI